MPSSSVSSYDTRAKSDFWLYVVYVLSTFILYASCLTTLFFIVSKSEKKGIKSFTKRNPEVLLATIIVIGSFLFAEILAELIMAIIWTVSVRDHLIGFTVFAAALVYYGPGIFSLYKVGRKCYRYYNLESHKNDSKLETSNKSSSMLDVDSAKIDTVFKCFVWITAYFAYILLYSFFPAFVLAFAYPTRVITMFAFIATFLVLSIVYLTTYIKKGFNLKSLKNIRPKFIKVANCIVLMILQLYFFLFIFALLYSLVIGRASVVSSAPLAVLSLLPSILISIAAWVMKSTMLNNGNDVKDEDKENEIDGKANTNKQLIEKEANHDGECEVVVASTKPITPDKENKSSEEKKVEDINENGEAIANGASMLMQKEESCNREEKVQEIELQEI